MSASLFLPKCFSSCWRTGFVQGVRQGGARLVLLAFAALVSGPAGSALGQVPAETEAQQFEKIFGRRPPALPRAITVPFILDRQSRGEILVMVSTNQDAVKIEAAPFLKELAGKARPEILEQVRSAVNPQGQISLAQLKAVGLEAEFDEQKLEVRAAVPPALRQDSTIDLFGRRPPPGAELALAPSSFSAYLNLLTGFDWVEQSTGGQNEGVQPFRADLEGAVHLRDWVVEGNASYTQDASSEWRRGDWRLVRDDPAHRIRYSLGDLAYPTIGFQGFQSLFGLTVARNFSLQPYQVTQPRGQTSFFLKTPSKVEVLVNGQPVQTLQLPAGPHNMRDFPFVSGGNDAVLRITDDVGRVETIQLSFFFDPRLLAAGEQEFSYSFGYPSTAGETGPDYDFNQPTVLLFHRVGFSDTFTAGLNFEGNQHQQMLGADSVWATPFGTFQTDVAVSTTQDAGAGCAARLGYVYYDQASSMGSTWTFAVQNRSPSFASLGTMDPNNTAAWDLLARYSQGLPWGMSGGVGGSYQISRGDNENLAGVNFSLNKHFGHSCFANLTLDRRDKTTGETEYRAFISLTVLFSGGRQSLRTSYDSSSHISQADWQYTSARPVGGLYGNLGIQNGPDASSVFGSARYTGYRADASFSQNVTTPNSSDPADIRSSFRFGSAVVYADGQLALSRPVQDSFAIISPHPDLKGQKIGVDPIGDSYTEKIDRWGPAVVPNLNAYLFRSVAVDAPEMPPGYELGPGSYMIRPTYKSGTLIRVGTGATVLLGGILETADGTPVSLQAGEIVSISDPNMKSLELFTNRRGKFSLEGLRPGTFEIRLFTDPPAAVRFEIPKGKVGIYDIGTLRLPKPSAVEPPKTSGENK